MPGPRSKLTLATAVREGIDDLPGTVAVQYVCDALKKCIDDPGLGWPAAVTSVVAAAGVVNPVSVAGLVGLGVAIGVTRLRKNRKQAQKVEAQLRAQAAADRSMHDILLGLKDRSITVGLDELALTDIQEIVTQAINNQAPRLNDKLEAAFNAELDELPPGPLRDELDNLRVLAQDTNTAVHDNAAGIATANTGIGDLKEELAELKRHILANSPPSQEAPAASPSGDDTLDSALLRLARDAARGVETARKAVEDKSPREAGDYFVDKLANLDRSRAAIEKRMDQDEIQISREAAELLYRTGRIADAERALQRILALSADDLDATNRLGHIHRLRGDLPAAQSQYERVLKLAPGDQGWRAVALGNLGLIARTRGDLDGAESLLRKGLAIERKLGRLEGQASALGNLGLIARTRGDLDGAESLLREALAIERKLGRLEGQASELGNLGLIARTRGDLDGAETLHREALAIEHKLGRLEGQASELGNLGLIARTRGDLDGAESLHLEALEIDRKLGRLEGQAITLVNLSDVKRELGALSESQKLAENALAIFQQIGHREGAAEALLSLGKNDEKRSHIDSARQYWTQSRNLFRTVGMQPEVEQVQARLDGLPPR